MKSVLILTLAQHKEKLYKDFLKKEKAFITSSSVQLNKDSYYLEERYYLEEKYMPH